MYSTYSVHICICSYIHMYVHVSLKYVYRVNLLFIDRLRRLGDLPKKKIMDWDWRKVQVKNPHRESKAGKKKKNPPILKFYSYTIQPDLSLAPLSLIYPDISASALQYLMIACKEKDFLFFLF